MEDGLGWELRIFIPGDEVWVVPEGNPREREEYGEEHVVWNTIVQAMWVTQTEPRQGRPGVWIPLSREPQVFFLLSLT